jgi:hypothetical protein
LLEPAVIRHLAAAGFALGGIAVILGLSSTPLVPEAQRLMVPGGFLLLPAGVWHARHRSAHVAHSGLPHGFSAAFFTSIGVALIGAGMAYDHPDAPWLALLVPGGITMSFFAYWLAFSPNARGFQRKWLACTAPCLRERRSGSPAPPLT